MKIEHPEFFDADNATFYVKWWLGIWYLYGAMLCFVGIVHYLRIWRPDLAFKSGDLGTQPDVTQRFHSLMSDAGRKRKNKWLRWHSRRMYRNYLEEMEEMGYGEQ